MITTYPVKVELIFEQLMYYIGRSSVVRNFELGELGCRSIARRVRGGVRKSTTAMAFPSCLVDRMVVESLQQLIWIDVSGEACHCEVI